VCVFAFRLLFAVGKIRGTLSMRSHILVLGATTTSFSISFVFKTKIEKEGLPRDSPAVLGAGSPRFKSGRPDQNHLAYFLVLIELPLQPKLRCGILPGRRSELPSLSTPMTWPRREPTEMLGGRSARKKLLNRDKLSTRQFASMGKIG
jgi:hypothetical protein